MFETATLAGQLRTSPLTLVMSNFQSLGVADAEAFRRKLDGRATVVAAKNRMARIAARQTGLDLGDLTGQTTLVFVTSNEGDVLRDVLAFLRTHPVAELVGGARPGEPVRGYYPRSLSTDELSELASEPLAEDAVVEAEEEQTTFDVVLVATGGKKIQVIKAIRELAGLGLKDAKDAAESTPFTVMEGVSQDRAQVAFDRLVAEGAEVEMR